MRAHFYRPVVDNQGNLIPDVTVRIREPDGSTEISQSIYPTDVGTTPMANPFPVADGIINFYLDEPRRVQIGVQAGAEPEVLYDNVDVLRVEGDSAASKNPTYSGMVYDGSDNLTAWVEDGVPCSATYDPVTGNMSTMTIGSVTRTFTYDTDGRMTGAT